MDEGVTAFAVPFKALLLRAVATGRRGETLNDSTLAKYRADLDRGLTRLLARNPTSVTGGKPARAIRR